jgi:Na+/proline symporter
MQALDYAVIAAFLLLVVAIGFVAARRVRGSGDYFVAGGRIPWWLGGISHHVSGHSGVVFVGLAAVAYRHGLSLYLWWAVTIGLACLVGAYWFAPRWVRLREALAIESPTEYLVLRYNRPTPSPACRCRSGSGSPASSRCCTSPSGACGRTSTRTCSNSRCR